MLGQDVVLSVAKLARLSLTSEEVDRFTGQLGQILSHIDQLNALDTQNVVPTSHQSIDTGAFREDVAQPSLPCSVALENALESEGGFFKVPKIISAS